MPRVYYSTIISAPIEEVWEYVRDFNALPKWHPGIKASEIEEAAAPTAPPAWAASAISSSPMTPG